METAYQQGYKELSELGTNFLLKAKLSYVEYYPNNYDWISRNWLIEESVFGDEKNSIVTLITQEKGGIEIKVFRDFKTQNISLICVQNECGQNVDLLDKNLKGFPPGITQILRAALLLGTYRMIMCETNEKQLYIYPGHWGYTYSCGTFHLTSSLQGLFRGDE
uniref:Uncharacterized protein n=1 Tax=Tetranychus urticae TaxID=32264 RepID=T1JV11_TETUR